MSDAPRRPRRRLFAAMNSGRLNLRQLDPATYLDAGQGVYTDAAASFVGANQQFLSAPSNASLQTGNVDFWVSFWFKEGTRTVESDMVSKYGPAGSEWLVTSLNGTIRFYNLNGSVTFGVASAGAWHHAFAWQDATNGTINLSVDGGTVVTVLVSPVFAPGSNPLTVGRSSNGGQYDGQIDSLAFGKSPPGGIAAIADSLITRLYNAGVGRVYDDLAGLTLDKRVAANFVAASSQSLSRADNAGLRIANADAWLSCWVKFTTTTGFQGLVSKDAGGFREWALYSDNGQLRFMMGNGGSIDLTAGITTPADGLWHHVFCWQDVTANTINLSLDGATPVTLTRTITPTGSTNALTLGFNFNGFLDGRLDCVAFGKSPPGGFATTTPASIRDSLYNSGSGKAYADLTAAQKTAWGLVSFWEFQTLLADSHGTNTLTNNNAVVQTPFGKVLKGTADLRTGAGLVSWWNLDEPTGNRYDAHGANHLADVTPATITGQAANFVAASSQTLSRASNATLQSGDIEVWGAAWVNLASLPANAHIMAKADSGTNAREYRLLYSATRFRLEVSGDGIAETEVSLLSPSPAVTGTWYFLMWYHDPVANTIGISVNGGAFTTAAHTTGVFVGAAAFQMGGRNSTPTEFWDGKIDSVAFGKSVTGGFATTTPATIRDALYAAGVGVAYSQLSAAQKTAWGLVSWWEFETLTTDSHGTNTLTNNNAVTQVAGQTPTANSAPAVGVAAGIAAGNVAIEGIPGKAAFFTAANSESLSVANNATLQTGPGVAFWVAGWYKLTTGASTGGIANKLSVDAEWILFSNGGVASFQTRSGVDRVSISQGVSTAWRFVMAYYDPVNTTTGISIDGGAFTTFTGSAGPLLGTSVFKLGSNEGGVGYFDGGLDSWAFGKSPAGGLTPIAGDLAAALYNSGRGRSYDALAGITLASMGAAKFVAASTQSLSRVSNATLQTGNTDWWAAGWVNPVGVAGQQCLVSKYAAANFEFLIYLNNAAITAQIVALNGSGSDNAVGNSNAVAGAWTFWFAWYDSAANTINIKINNGTTVSTNRVVTLATGTAPFTLGLTGNSTFPLNGKQDSVAFGKGPTGGFATTTPAAISTSLYNNGAGKVYADLTGAEKAAWGLVSFWDFATPAALLTDGHGTNTLTNNNGVGMDQGVKAESSGSLPTVAGLVSFWDLEEASGLRDDAHGANDLTDNNTVTQTDGAAERVGDFSPVSVWVDQGSRGRNVLQATVSKRPLFRRSIINGRPVVRFDGSDDFLQAAFGLVQPTYIAMVTQSRLDTGLARLLDGKNVDTGDVYQATAGNMALFAGAGPVASVPFAAGTFHIAEILFSGASSYIRIDGGTAATGNAGTSAMGGITLGAGATPSNFAPVDIAELVVFPAEPTAGVRAALRAMWASKYGIPSL
jgi:hypothetical protein